MHLVFVFVNSVESYKFNHLIYIPQILKPSTSLAKPSCANKKMGAVESIHSSNKFHGMIMNLLTKAELSVVLVDIFYDIS